MPEGPEIRRVADRLHAVLVGRVAEDVELHLPRLKPWESELRGTTVRSVRPRGKALLTRFERGWSVYSHNQLYGRWYVQRRGSRPKTRRQLRFAVHTAEHSALLYSASSIEVLDEQGLAEHPFLRRLGPDVLDPDTTVDQVLARLEDPRFLRRGLAGTLLSQECVSGLGNYLRSEVLFFARVPPRARPVDLDRRQRRRLARVLLEVSRRSYRTAGVTSRPTWVREAQAEGRSRREYRHAVFRRGGRSCLECGAVLRQERISARVLSWCPDCQAE